MKYRVPKYLFISFVLAIIVSCNLFGPSTEPESDGTEDVLASLGINTNVAPRLDPSGNAVSPDVQPLGDAVISLDPYHEFFQAGINLTSYSPNPYYLLTEQYCSWAGNVLNAGQLWTDDWTTLPKKAVFGDFDGDGYDEMAMLVLVMADNKIELRTMDDKMQGFSLQKKTLENISATINPLADAYDATRFTLSTVYTLFDIQKGNLDEDSAEELVVVYHDTLYIYDDANHAYALITSKRFDNFVSRGSYTENKQTYVRAAIGDVDADGSNELVAVVSVHYDNIGIFVDVPFYVYDDVDNLSSYKTGMVRTGSSAGEKMYTAHVTTGNVDGVKGDEIIFSGSDAGDNATLMIFKWNSAEYTCLARASTINTPANSAVLNNDWYDFYTSVCANLDGSDRDSIVFNNEILRYGIPAGGASSVIHKPYGDWAAAWNKDHKYDLFADLIIAGNFDGNDEGREQVILMQDWQNEVDSDYSKPGILFCIERTTSGTIKQNMLAANVVTSYPTIARGNVDDDSPVIEYTGVHELVFSQPIVLAALASAPYHASVDYDGWEQEVSTEYGESNGVEQSSSNSVGFNVGVSIGVENDIIVFVTKVGGYSFKASIENSFTWAYSDSFSQEASYGFETPGGEDMVVFTAIPYDVYYYRFKSSKDPSLTGKVFSLNVPRSPIMTSAERSFYNSHNGDGEDIDARVFAHTIGQPATYPDLLRIDNMSNVAGAHFEYYGPKNITVGVGSGASSQGIDIAVSQGSSFAYNLDVKLETELNVGSVTVGASAGLSYGHEASSTITDGTSFAGAVPNIPASFYDTSLAFSWRLGAWEYVLGEQNFIVVNYLVSNGSQLP